MKTSPPIPANNSEPNRSRQSHHRPRQGSNQRHANNPAQMPPRGKHPGYIYESVDNATFIVFDIETTGGNPDRNAMTELCALKYKGGEVVDQFYSLINPKMPIPPIVRRMTGIDNAMVKNAPLVEDVMPKFVSFIGNATLVSHNTIGDMKFLRHYSHQTTGKAIDNFFLCTHLLVERLVPEAPNRSLKGLGQFFKFVAKGALHRADADAFMTLDLFLELRSRFAKKNLRTVADAIRFQGDYESGMRLGWAVDSRSLQELPERPGVLNLYDRNDKLHFAVALFNLRRDIHRLLKYQQLPKGLLRIVLNSYRIDHRLSTSHFAAIQDEATQLNRHRSLYPPINWHQRSIPGVVFVRGVKHVTMFVGDLREGAIASFGPVHDRKEVMLMLQRVCEICGGSFDKEFTIPNEFQAVLSAFFTGQLESYLQYLRERGAKLWLNLFSGQRLNARKQLDVAQKLMNVALKSPMTSLLDINGALVVRDQDSNKNQVYKFQRGLHSAGFQFDGEPALSLDDSKVVAKLNRQVVAKVSKKIISLSAAEAQHANATLWWIVNHSRGNDGRFYSSEQISLAYAASKLSTQQPALES